MKLYRHPEVSAKPGVQAAIAASEAAADRLCELIGADYAVCALPEEGIGGWRSCDLSPLVGRPVLLFAEHTPDSIADMRALARHLTTSLECQLKGIVIPADQLPDWTPADWQEDEKAFRLWAGKHLEADLPAPEVPDVAPQSPEIDPEHPAWVEPPEDAALLKERPKPRKPRLAVVDGNTVREVVVDPAHAPMSEGSIAEHFLAERGLDWRYCTEWSKWLQWNGDGWLRDRRNAVSTVLMDICKDALEWPEGKALTPSERRKISQKRTAWNARDIAAADKRISAIPEQFDSDPMLLGVPGGVIDLATADFIPPNREQYITRRTRIAPQRGDAPIWQQFLRTVTADNEEIMAFLQRWAGYCLTGLTREQCLAFLYGHGQNGKGVFINTLASILGDYAVGADADVFMESQGNRHTTEIARLAGARLVFVDETDSAQRWNEKRIKRYTGGGKVEARFMRQDDFEFMPQFKLLIAGNHKPQLRGVGKAIQRRINLVPFTVTIRDEDRDDDLPRKLEAEYPQILQWALDGCAQWQSSGLQVPAEIREATAQYLDAEDVIGEWIEERTEQSGRVERPSAYKNYRSWAESRGERARSSKAFSAALEERGYAQRKHTGTFYIEGMQLKATAPDDGPPSWHNSD